MGQQQTAYHGYQGSRANANQYREQERQREHRAGEAAKLRREAAAMGEEIFDVTCTANRIGLQDGWKGTCYEAICGTLRQMRADRLALLARANEFERPGA